MASHLQDLLVLVDYQVIMAIPQLVIIWQDIHGSASVVK